MGPPCYFQRGCTAPVIFLLLVLPAAGRGHPIAMRLRRHSFLRRLDEPASQRWQNLHSKPVLHPFVWMKAHGLHVPKRWSAEPVLGRGSLRPPSTSARRKTGTGSALLASGAAEGAKGPC